MANLQKVFYDLAQRHGASPEMVQQLWEELQIQYQAKQRYYHNFQHLEALLNELMAVRQKVSDWDSLLWALFYHDFIYEVQRKDNEAQSAIYASGVLKNLNISGQQISSCTQYILATKNHTLTTDLDTNFFVDADLSILGQSSTVYHTYTLQIRQEYQVFPDEIYIPGRQRVVQHFLAMDRIFKSDFFYEKYEKQARVNLATEVR